MGESPGSPACQVVKIRTDDKAKTVVEPGFVEACSKSKIVVEEASPCEEFTFDAPDVYLDNLQEAIKYWESSKADTFDSARYLDTMARQRPAAFADMTRATIRLGYDLLFQEWSKAFRRALGLKDLVSS